MKIESPVLKYGLDKGGSTHTAFCLPNGRALICEEFAKKVLGVGKHCKTIRVALSTFALNKQSKCISIRIENSTPILYCPPFTRRETGNLFPALQTILKENKSPFGFDEEVQNFFVTRLKVKND